MSQETIGIVIPAYNEAENIGAVLAMAPRSVAGRAVTLLVVDDGSRDNTAEVAKQHGAMVVRQEVNQGGGIALREGFKVALEQDLTYVVTMDADGQHRMEDLEDMLEPLLTGQVDLVVGSRFKGRNKDKQLVRGLGVHFFSAMITLLVRQRVTDCSNGYRAIRCSALSQLTLVQDRHHTAEMILEVHHHRMPMCEVGVTVLPRLSGSSKKGPDLRYGARFARTIGQTWARGKVDTLMSIGRRGRRE